VHKPRPGHLRQRRGDAFARLAREGRLHLNGLHGTPTTFILEERIATLEGGTRTLLAPRVVLAAIALVDIALLKSGDRS